MKCFVSLIINRALIKEFARELTEDEENFDELSKNSKTQKDREYYATRKEQTRKLKEDLLEGEDISSLNYSFCEWLIVSFCQLVRKFR